MEAGTSVALEVGTKRVFAAALDWPGWCRAGRDEAAALAALTATAWRYRRIAAASGLALPPDDDLDLRVVERIAGDATTDFGAPGKVADADRRPLDAAAADRQARLLETAWAVLDEIVATAPLALRLGPRGGGRNRDAVYGHVVRAEASYAHQVGLRLREPDPADRIAIGAQRAAIAALLRQPSDGSPLAGRRWPSRYAARRVAWHVLDHAWEIEDRTDR